MNKALVSLLAVTAMASGVAFAADDTAADKDGSDACVACHGVGGVSSDDAFPSLAGQRQSYLVKELKVFSRQSGWASPDNDYRRNIP
jgi:cytochrome c553